MGQGSAKPGLENAAKRVEERVGKITVTGRYHRRPKTLEQDYQLSNKVLGSGYNGQVFLASNKQTGQGVAVKAFKLNGVGKDKRDELVSECEIFLAMDHPHVARLVDVYESDDRLDLVMECMTGGELFKRVVSQKRFSQRDAADASWQMLLAINYVHTHGIVHRDIKLENWLYESPTSQHLKLIDFGFSKIWQPNTKMAMSCGTLAYVAPEVLRQSYTSQCDMWSLGVTVFILLFGYMPFSGREDQQVAAIREGRYTIRQASWNRVSPEAQDFVKKLLVVNTELRMTAEQALKHTWILQREKLQQSTLDQEMIDSLYSFGQGSAFRRACMSMMAWSLTNEERAKVRNAFIELDVERTGTIKLSEFKQVLETKFNLADEGVVQTFRNLDVNNTDEIHYSEFLAAMMSSRIAMHDDLLMATFKRFDTDSSGYITLGNLREVLGESFEGEEVSEILKEVDTSGDAKISYKEFIEYLRSGGADDKHAEVAAKVIDREIKKTGTIQKILHIRNSFVGSPKDAAEGLTVEASDEHPKAKRCGCVVL